MRLFRITSLCALISLSAGAPPLDAGVYQLTNIDQFLQLDGGFEGALDSSGRVTAAINRLEGDMNVRRIHQQVSAGEAASVIFENLSGINRITSFGDVGSNGAFSFNATTPTAGRAAFLYSPENGFSNIGSLAGFDTEVYAMNGSGQLTGDSFLEDDLNARAYLYSREIGMMSLGTLGGDFSNGYGINELGHVVGRSQFDSSDAFGVPFIWTPEDRMELISDVPGNRFAGTAQDINESGWVVGDIRGGIFIRTAEGMFVPNVGEFFVTTPGGNVINRTVGGTGLKMLENDFAAFGTSSVINLGSVRIEPWRWTEEGGTEFFDEFEIDGFLDDDWDFNGFYDANESGQILANAIYRPTNEGFTVLLSPVPEPSVVLLLVLGGAGIFMRRKRGSEA